MYFNSCGTNNNLNRTFIIEPLSMTGSSPTFSACTAVYTNKIISCSGNTEILLTSGVTVFNTDVIVEGDITGNTMSATTYYGDGSNLTGIDNTFSGGSGNCITDFYVTNIHGCSPITLHDELIPSVDNSLSVGTPLKRFREINALSGRTTVFTATTRVTTPILDLGFDSSGNTRIITANNSVVQDDILFGGGY